MTTANTTCAPKTTTPEVNQSHLCLKLAVLSGESPESMQQVHNLASATAVATTRTDLDLPAPTASHGHDTPRGRQASRSRRISGRKGDHPSSSVRKSTTSARPAQAPRRGRRKTAPRIRSQNVAPNTPPHAAPVKRGGRPRPRSEAASRIAEPLQSQWGLSARDAHACAKTLLQEDIGLTCIFQLGLLSKVHLAALTKGLSHIGGTIIKPAWEDLKNARFSFFPAAGATFLNPFPNQTPDSPI